MSDIFAYLNAMNRGDFGYVDRMSDEEVKGLSPFVLLMWCNGATKDRPIHTILTNVYCNDMVFPLSKHPRLLLKLFISANCEIGDCRYKFKKSISSEKSAEIKMIANHYQCSYTEARDYHDLLSSDDLKRIKEIYDK